MAEAVTVSNNLQLKVSGNPSTRVGPVSYTHLLSTKIPPTASSSNPMRGVGVIFVLRLAYVELFSSPSFSTDRCV